MIKEKSDIIYNAMTILKGREMVDKDFKVEYFITALNRSLWIQFTWNGNIRKNTKLLTPKQNASKIINNTCTNKNR